MLLALDFAAGVVDVVSQPMRLRFDAAKRRAHTPDFLVTGRSGTWLIDVRPERLIREADLESFAAAADVAAACGWGYVVAAGWREHAWAALDAFSSQRRRLVSRTPENWVWIWPTLVDRSWSVPDWWSGGEEDAFTGGGRVWRDRTSAA